MMLHGGPFFGRNRENEAQSGPPWVGGGREGVIYLPTYPPSLHTPGTPSRYTPLLYTACYRSLL